MSTKSKTRAQKRKWMNEAKAKFEERGISLGRERGYREGSDDTRRAITRLIPDYTRDRIEASGKMGNEVILKFPLPQQGGQHQRYLMPSVPDFYMRSYGRAREIGFRPTLHALQEETENGIARMLWYSWEPETGSDEHIERTRAMFTGMGKLGVACSMIQGMIDFAPMIGPVELTRVLTLVSEARDELRQKLGKEAPEPDLNEAKGVYGMSNYAMQARDRETRGRLFAW